MRSLIPTDWLRHRAASRPEVLALRDEGGRALTYAELFERAAAVASRIPGPAPGHICVIELAPGIDHAIAMHAAILAAMPFQTVRPRLPAAERKAALAGLTEPLAFDPAWLEAAPTAGVPAGSTGGSPEDPLCRVLTSGTSGTRAAVTQTYGNHFSSAAASAFNLGIEPTDSWLCCLPVDHVGGLSILLRSVIYGTTAIIHPRFEVERVASELERGATIISLVPTQLQRLLAADAALERARLILLGGGPVPDGILDQALARGANVVQTYGLTEACSQVCTLTAADATRKRGSVGRPLLGTEVQIGTRDADGGEILVSGPTVAPGCAGPDGWLRTGDRGTIDGQGFLWVQGRIDDLIISGGENIAPEEVEQALLSHPAVSEAAVVGRPDSEWGAAVVALVVAAGGVGADELIEHCRGSLAPHKLPKRIEFVAQLPRTETGKLLRRELR